MIDTPYEPFDQDIRLPLPPWSSDDPAVLAWELAHGHDVRLKCYVEFGCLVIEPTLEREIGRLKEQVKRLAADLEAQQDRAIALGLAREDALREIVRLRTPSEWTREESKEFLYEATKASYAEGVRAGCEELSIHAADMDVELEQLRAELHQAKAEWFEEKKRARELEESLDEKVRQLNDWMLQDMKHQRLIAELSEENEMLRGAAGALGGGV